ncbi:MAG: transglutaminase family protein [Clostridiales bacterium]|nr:transglutaminase family protein [Clostridiales bacterium]
MEIQQAIDECRAQPLSGWELVAYAQSLVQQHMAYAVDNSTDTPQAAFEKGRGYCYHHAHVMCDLIDALGFQCQIVYAFRTFFPEVVVSGVQLRRLTSGHMWCRVRLDGATQDVCSCDPGNAPGKLHFRPKSKVRPLTPLIDRLTYRGSAGQNARRQSKVEAIRKKQDARWIPELCPCKKTSCERYRKCSECRDYHASRNNRPACERY